MTVQREIERNLEFLDKVELLSRYQPLLPLKYQKFAKAIAVRMRDRMHSMSEAVPSVRDAAHAVSLSAPDHPFRCV